MRCPNCSTELPDIARFCMQCGHPQPAAQPPAAQPPAAQPLAAQSPAAPQPAPHALAPGAWPPASVPERETPFVGRSHELPELLTAVRRLYGSASSPGAGSAVFIVGEPGLGKARLIREMRRVLHASPSGAPGQAEGAPPPLTWLQVTADPARRLRAYGLFVDLVQQVSGPGPRALEETVLALFPDHPDEILPYLETLLSRPVPLDRAERVSFLQPEELRQQMYRAMYEFLVQLARRAPVVLVLKELHWADAASAALLADLIPAITAHPLLVLATLQPETEVPSQTPILKGREVAGLRYQELRLGPLSWVDARELLDRLLPDDTPEPLRAKALTLARGNPLYVEMVADALAEEVALDPPPHNLVTLLVTRVARLPADLQRTLQLLSVIGQHAPGTRVEAVAAASHQAEGLPERLSRLAARRWLDLEPGTESATGSASGGEPVTPAYAFHHPLLGQAAYQSMPPARRRQLHALVAAEIERAHTGDEAELEHLAYHCRLAEDRERALVHTLAAAQKALQRCALDTARAHFLAGEHLAQQLGRAAHLAEIDEALAEIATQQGRLEEAEARYRSALARVPVANSPVVQARVRTRLGREYERRGQALLWMNELQVAHQVLSEAGLAGSPAWITVMTDLAWAHYSRAEYAAAAERCAEATRALGELEPTVEVLACRGHAENVLGTVCRAQGNYSGALDHFLRALQTTERTGDLGRAAACHANVGEVWRQLGDPSRAVTHYHAARECYERMGRLYGILLVDNNAGLAYLQSADWDAAQHLLSSVIERAQAKGYTWLLSETHWGLGEVLLAQGDVDGARGQGSLALTMAEKHGNVVDRALAQRLLAKITLREGDAKAGRLRLRELLRTFEGIGEKREVCVTALDLAEALLAGSLPDEAAPLLAQAETLSGEMQARDLAARALGLRQEIS